MKHFFTALAATLLFLVASVAFAQTLPPGVSQAQIDAALADLTLLYGSPVVRIDQAKAICNEEQYMVECAEIGKKHGLFSSERAEQVDTLLQEIKGDVVDKLKACGTVECLVGVAASLAERVGGADPALARSLDLTVQKIEEKRIIVEEAKSVGVDFEECRAMDPDTAPVELLRACARLAKSERIQQFIPEEDRQYVERNDRTIELKEALQSGEVSCGDGTIEGCGTFCLNPTASAGETGLPSIPQICRDIAERYFGSDSVRELERAHGTVQETFQTVRDYQRPLNPPGNRESGATGTPRYLTCPAFNYAPCPNGHYRQESVNEFGCPIASACVPFNTKTQAEPTNGTLLCPALPTVESCQSGEELVVSFTSPECGTYYGCRPKIEKPPASQFPYTFGSGRVILSFEEARTYCYESGASGATERGDKAQCMSVFGIAVPDIPPEKQSCELRFGEGWHNVDESGNCFNAAMTEYVTYQGVLKLCAEVPVYGCAGAGYVPNIPSGQKEQVWNDKGLRSWIRSDADPGRIATLKTACAGVSGSANVWFPGAGTFSDPNFGMPDPGKCKLAAACKADQYFTGSSCSTYDTWGPVSVPPYTGPVATTTYKGDATSCPGFAYSRWDSRGDRYCQLNTTRACQYFYPAYLSEGNYTAAGCPVEDQSTGGVTGSCSQTLISLLGNGCHSMGSAWFDSSMTMYVLPGGSTVRSCASEYLSGCSGGGSSTSCPSGQYWSGSACVTSAPGSSMQRCFYPNATINGTPPGYTVWCEADYVNCHVGDPSGAPVSLQGLSLGAPSQCESGWTGGSTGGTTVGSECRSQITQATCSSVSGCNWYIGSSGAYCDSGGSVSTGSSCPSGQYWNGSACQSDTSGPANCSTYASQSSCTAVTNCYWSSGSSPYCYYQSSPPGTTCGTGEYWDTQTNSCRSTQTACAEAGGTWDSAANYCQMPGTTSCPSNQYWDGSACVTSPSSGSSTSCPSGQYWNGSVCVTTSTTDCPSGQYWSGSACVTSTTGDASSDPAAGCAGAGGTWDSATNYCQMPNTTSLQYQPLAYLCPSGLVWNGGYCVPAPRSGLETLTANIFSAVASLFGF